MREYAILIAKIRGNIFKMKNIEEAVNKAVDECISEGIMSEYLLKHKAEVIDMCLTEYNEAETMEAFRRAGIEAGKKAGIEAGKQIGKQDTLIELVKDGLLSLERAAEKMNVSVEEFEKIMKK